MDITFANKKGFLSKIYKSINIPSLKRLDKLLMVGNTTIDEAVKAGLSAESVRSFDTSLEAADYLRPLIAAGDIVLLKGSQSMRMERVVKALMDEPGRAGELLVRQDQKWLEKK